MRTLLALNLPVHEIVLQYCGLHTGITNYSHKKRYSYSVAQKQILKFTLHFYTYIVCTHKRCNYEV